MNAKFSRWLMALSMVATLASLGTALAAEEKPAALNDVGLRPVLGTQLPLQEEFVDESGKTVKLQSFFDGQKPVIFVMNYYSCPMLCGMLLNGARDAVQKLDWKPGDHYRIVTISIDPKEDADLAAAKKASILGSLKDEKFRAAADRDWHFLVGRSGSEARLAASLGFLYKWIPEEKQYAHGAALFIASPEGKLTRVLEGIQFEPRDLKFALLESAQGKVGTFAEKLMLFCYHYDPKDNKYALLASRLVSLGGAVTVAALLFGYLVWFLRNRRKGNACSLSP
ncbi:MAG: SCO family protein [Proteobacteria bacterium]|nr:MAG: SCO family protein [Pseudomonadota bacterium]